MRTFSTFGDSWQDAVTFVQASVGNTLRPGLGLVAEHRNTALSFVLRKGLAQNGGYGTIGLAAGAQWRHSQVRVCECRADTSRVTQNNRSISKGRHIETRKAYFERGEGARIGRFCVCLALAVAQCGPPIQAPDRRAR
jgi:hypothetical protein